MGKKNFEIGETFQCGLVKLKVEKAVNQCDGCFFEQTPFCMIEMLGDCIGADRDDNTDVIFVKVEE